MAAISKNRKFFNGLKQLYMKSELYQLLIIRAWLGTH